MALAFDSAVDGGNNGGGSTNLTFAFNNVAGDIMFVGFNGDTIANAFDDVTSVVYDTTQNLSLLAKRATGTLNRFAYLYLLQSPHTGSHNVVITCGSAHYLLGGAVSYSGSNSTGQPDASTTSESSSVATTWTTSLSSVANNCWHMLLQTGTDSDEAPGVGAGTTQRVKEAAFGTWSFVDSNSAKTPAGSVSLTTTYTFGGWPICHIMATIAPLAAVIRRPNPIITSKAAVVRAANW